MKITASNYAHEKGSVVSHSQEFSEIVEAFLRRGEDCVPSHLRNVNEKDVSDAMYALRAAIAELTDAA